MMFKKKTVDAVMAVFGKAIEDLAEVARSSRLEAEQQERTILEARTKCDEALGEESRALRVASKLQQIINA